MGLRRWCPRRAEPLDSEISGLGHVNSILTQPVPNSKLRLIAQKLLPDQGPGVAA